MKAIRVKEFGGPEVLRLEEVPTPEPGPGQVLVRIHATGINPVETYIRAGTYARLPGLPYTPGNDGAGVVERAGADVSEFKAGDRVYTAGSISGTYAEFALCKNEQVHPLPANVSFAQGAAMATPYGQHIADYCNAAMRSQVKRSYCMVRAEVLGLQGCNWHALAVCACWVQREVREDLNSHAKKALTKYSIIARLIILSR